MSCLEACKKVAAFAAAGLEQCMCSLHLILWRFSLRLISCSSPNQLTPTFPTRTTSSPPLQQLQVHTSIFSTVLQLLNMQQFAQPSRVSTSCLQVKQHQDHAKRTENINFSVITCSFVSAWVCWECTMLQYWPMILLCIWSWICFLDKIRWHGQSACTSSSLCCPLCDLLISKYKLAMFRTWSHKS